MRCYAFLHGGSRSLLSGIVWPRPEGGEPGAWVAAGPGMAPDAVRGLRPEHFARWFDDELWHAELSGQLAEGDSFVSAERGRLLGRVEGWTPEAAETLASEYAFRLRDHAADVFRKSGRSDAAGQLEACTELDDLGRAATEIAGASANAGEARLADYVADSVTHAQSAISGAQKAAVVSFIAAFAISGATLGLPDCAERFDAERRWQSDRLRESLLI